MFSFLFMVYEVIACVILLVISPFILLSIPWKKIPWKNLSQKKLKEDLIISHNPKMDISDLDDWNNDSIILYYELIKDEYKRYNVNEDEINQRSTSLLAVEGVILALMVAFLNPTTDTPIILFLFVTSAILLFVSILFIVWAIRPVNRKVLDLHGHKECNAGDENSYYPFRKDPNGLKKAILHDMLIFTESLNEIYPRKVKRFACALYFFIVAMLVLVLMFFVHVFT